MGYTIRPRVRHYKSGVVKIRRDSYSNATTDWWTIRNEVFKRDNGVCQKRINGRICGCPGVDVHHIIPLGRGGTTTKTNLMTVCKDHHNQAHRKLK